MGSDELSGADFDTRAIAGPAAALPPGAMRQGDFQRDGEPGTLLGYWNIVRRRKGALLLMVFLCTAAALLITLLQTPVYEARTTLEIQDINEDFMRMREISPTAQGGGYTLEYDIHTQVDILQSRALIDRAAEKLAAARPLRHRVTASPGWRWALRRRPPPSTAEELAASTDTGLNVRARPNTRLVEILYDSPDPELAADFANTLASEYIEQNLEGRWQTAQHMAEWLSRQLGGLKKQLQESEDRLQAYAREAHLVFTSSKEDVSDDRLKQLQDELTRAQGDRIVRQSRYELAASASNDALAEVLQDDSFKDIQRKLVDLTREQAELTSLYTAAHPKVLRVRAQIDTLQAALKRERANVLDRIRTDFISADRREKLLAAEYANQVKFMSEQAGKIVQYDILKREVDTNRQAYETMLQRVKDAAIASAMRASNIRVVDPAFPTDEPSRPRPLLNAGLGLLTGLFFGTLLLVFRERAHQPVEEPGVALSCLGVPELGVVPRASIWAPARWGLLPGGRRKDADPSLALTAREQAATPLADSFAALLASLRFIGQNGARPRVLVFSSAGPGEGKTTICSNLAAALADIDLRVLVIDADLRRPQLQNIFGLPNDTGLVNLLRRQPVREPLNGEVSATNIPNLSVLTCGAAKPSDLKLLYSARLAEIIHQVRRQYDVTLIDTPPALAVADARVIARYADGVVLVVRASTPRESVYTAFDRFQQDGTRVIGTVLNDWNPSHSPRYRQYYASYQHYYRRADQR